MNTIPAPNTIHEFSNVNKPPYATMFGARFYCALTLHVSAPICGHLQVLCDKIYSEVATFMSTDKHKRSFLRIYFVT
jgi:hypothetical protein